MPHFFPPYSYKRNNVIFCGKGLVGSSLVHTKCYNVQYSTYDRNCFCLRGREGKKTCRYINEEGGREKACKKTEEGREGKKSSQNEEEEEGCVGSPLPPLLPSS